jgi:AraC family transcriptional regulator of adaptative response / DNA-3-methyladenine glycosylase II
LAPLVAERPGLRAPGAADPEELAVRAVLGDGRAPADARRCAGLLAAAHGDPLPSAGGTLDFLFPTAAALATADLTGPGATGPHLPAGRTAAVHALSSALADGAVRLDAGADRDEAERMLLTLPGVSPSTARVIRMRALGDPDVLLADPGDKDAASWRPWRSYATHHLWVAADRGPVTGTSPARA